MALVLAPDLDSYLLALGHLPIMGRKQREKKAKRALAELNPRVATPCKAPAPKAVVAKRPASRPARAASAPTVPSKPNEPNEPNEPSKSNEPPPHVVPP